MPARLRLIKPGAPTGAADGVGDHAAPERPEPTQARLEEIFAAHHVMVWRLARRCGLGPEAAAEIVQQTFLAALARLDQLRRGSERVFLVAAALRATRAVRRNGNKLSLESDDLDIRPPVGTVSDDRGAVELCELALSRVDPALAEVFVLYEVVGLSRREISRMLELPPRRVTARLGQAREEFRVFIKRFMMRREGDE